MYLLAILILASCAFATKINVPNQSPTADLPNALISSLMDHLLPQTNPITDSAPKHYTLTINHHKFTHNHGQKLSQPLMILLLLPLLLLSPKWCLMAFLVSFLHSTNAFWPFQRPPPPPPSVVPVSPRQIYPDIRIAPDAIRQTLNRVQSTSTTSLNHIFQKPTFWSTMKLQTQKLLTHFKPNTQLDPNFWPHFWSNLILTVGGGTITMAGGLALSKHFYALPPPPTPPFPLPLHPTESELQTSSTNSI